MIFRLVLAAHLACAFGATALFWVPVVADKGGPLHLRAGRFYSYLIYLTALTGAPLAALMFAHATDEAARRTSFFLAYLITILVMPVYHGVRVIRAGRTGARVASPLHSALCALAVSAGVVLAALAIRWHQWPFLLLSPVGPVLGSRAFMYARRGGASARDEHIVSMLMSGVAVHTALLVFGSARTLGLKLTGASAYVPWLLPALIGLPLIVWRVRRERTSRIAR